MIAQQTQGVVDLSAGLAQIQSLLDSLEFWLVPVASPDSHRLARTLIEQHYPDERGCRMAVAPVNGRAVGLVLLEKSRMFPAELAAIAGLHDLDGSQDVLLTTDLPVSVVTWLAEVFR